MRRLRTRPKVVGKPKADEQVLPRMKSCQLRFRRGKLEQRAETEQIAAQLLDQEEAAPSVYLGLTKAPSRLGLARSAESASRANLEGRYFSAEAGRNQFRQQQKDQVGERLAREGQRIDLSGCMLQDSAYLMIRKSLKAKGFMQQLKLQSTRLRDRALDMLVGIECHLQVLNLSKNCLTDDSLLAISKIIAGARLNQLYLHWNQIATSTYNHLFWSTVAGSELVVLDLSCNNLAQDAASGVAFLLQRSGLKHLDLSLNKFTLEDSQLIAESLRDNHELVGLHFSGNFGTVARNGHLLVQSPVRQDIHSYRRLGHPLSEPHCWVCGRYSQVQITWPSPFLEQLKVHLESEQFAPLDLPVEGLGLGLQRIKVMLPPGKVRLFFSYLEYATAQLSSRLEARLAAYPLLIELGLLNLVEVVAEQPILDENYTLNISVKPRTERKYTLPAMHAKDWNYESSVFRFKSVIDSLRDEEVQWLKAHRVVREEESEQLRGVLEQYGAVLASLHNRLCVESAYNNGFGFQTKCLARFLTEAGLLESKNMAELENKLVLAGAIREKEGSRAGTRMQLIKLLVRAGEERLGKGLTGAEVLARVVEQHLLVRQFNFSYFYNFWRRSRYWCAEVDHLLRSYAPVFAHFYYLLRGTAQRLAFPPFRNFWLALQFGLTLEDIQEAFLYSAPLCSRHEEPTLSLSEFCQALARLSQRSTSLTWKNDQPPTQKPLRKKSKRLQARSPIKKEPPRDKSKNCYDQYVGLPTKFKQLFGRLRSMYEHSSGQELRESVLLVRDQSGRTDLLANCPLQDF